MKNENLEICKQCQGYCCKKSGCDYIPDDFPELSLSFLLAKLYEGYISIVSAQDFKSLPNGQIVNTPFLYLRARNVNRPIVDLLSMKTQCASLTKMGCAFTYEQRPYGGKNLVPVRDGICYPKEDPVELIKKWTDYQKVLSRAVKRITGKSVDEQLRQDVEQLFLDILLENFHGVSKRELEEIDDLLPVLIRAYPIEFENAQTKYNQSFLTRKLK